MEKEDPTIVTKALATDYDHFIAKVSSDVNVEQVGTQLVDGMASGWKDPNICGVKDTSESMGNVHGPINLGSHSFASILHNKETKKTVKVSVMRNKEKVVGAAVAIPLEVVKEMSSFFNNTLYGYFIGKKASVSSFGELHEEYFGKIQAGTSYVKTWFLFHPICYSRGNGEGVRKWAVVNQNAPVSVKLHHVPVVAYLEVGLSLISTQLRCPIMLDSFTSSMCLNPSGKSAYARGLIEMSARTELLVSVVVAIPFLDGTGHSLETIDVEYEWKPPRCNTCCIFYHVDDQYPKKPREVTTTQEDKDGFVDVKRKKGKAKAPIKLSQVEGIKLTKHKLNLQYRRVDKGDTSTAHEENKVDSMTVDPQLNGVRPNFELSRPKATTVSLKNSFSALSVDDKNAWGDPVTWQNAKQVLDVLNDSDSEDVDEVMELEIPLNTGGATDVGASTLKEVVSNV
ncbi:RNA-directed DNA polymerase, eukaryota, reverse transcriptase zinc-binding domain protein [Tanacetum coccineum]|uniref:RNA-directed DNA polymerase, eukaryota, reverse transcriptase zinc-binding domain protein n=1 Tax=Tanacetum coccineum TaxID=301880 RepID=A0ABQ5E2T1_9ASTR